MMLAQTISAITADPPRSNVEAHCVTQDQLEKQLMGIEVMSASELSNVQKSRWTLRARVMYSRSP